MSNGCDKGKCYLFLRLFSGPSVAAMLGGGAPNVDPVSLGAGNGSSEEVCGAPPRLVGSPRLLDRHEFVLRQRHEFVARVVIRTTNACMIVKQMKITKYYEHTK